MNFERFLFVGKGSEDDASRGEDPSDNPSIRDRGLSSSTLWQKDEWKSGKLLFLTLDFDDYFATQFRIAHLQAIPAVICENFGLATYALFPCHSFADFREALSWWLLGLGFGRPAPRWVPGSREVSASPGRSHDGPVVSRRGRPRDSWTLEPPATLRSCERIITFLYKRWPSKRIIKHNHISRAHIIQP